MKQYPPFVWLIGKKSPKHPGIKNLSRDGSALLVMIAAIVLLLLLILAFLSNSSIQQQVSKSSSMQATDDVFIQGAVSSIIGDLQQEIAAGATVTNVVAGAATNIIYLPATNAAAVPAISGFVTNAGLENLLKVSKGGTNFFPTNYPNAPTYPPSSRASTNSTTTPSLNGRTVSVLRWNWPLLLARQTPSSTTDFTPTTNFPVPQWIYVDRNGGNPTNWSTNMITSATNGTTVIGRYAYVVYHEGGLLDANVAGCPTNLTSTLFPPLASRPGSYVADLSQIGLTANQIGALVGWRNVNSASATGSFPTYTITNAGAVNYASNAMTATNGFLSTFTNATGSDRQFTSRQQLITFLQNADPAGVTNALNSLRYLGTFSRDLNQPTLYWPTNIPTIVSGIGTLANNYTDYGGGNSDYGNDFMVNTNFLTARVTANFTRNDGSTAVGGEPLVKKRFPLEYLSWITCKGPSAQRTLTDADMTALLTNPGVTPALLAKGTTNNIQNYFGLVWNNTDNLWDYAPAGSASTPVVQPLRWLSDLTGTREPNFIELLKAAIKAGSLGKSIGAMTVRGLAETNYQSGIHQYYTSTDDHVIQIAANIIEQSKTDAYPVRIRFSPDATHTFIFAGSDNLPYLYGWHNQAVQVSPPCDGTTPVGDPILPSSMVGVATNGQATNMSNVPANSFYYIDPSTKNQCFKKAVTTSLYPGYSVVLIIPHIWNPYDANSTTVPPAVVPSQLRIVADNTIMLGASTDGSLPLPPAPNSLFARIEAGNSGSDFSTPLATFNMNPSNSALTFNDVAALYREPTCLMTPGVPSGSGLFGITNPANLMGNGTSGMGGAALKNASGVALISSSDGSVTDWRDPSANKFLGIMVGATPLTTNYAYFGTNYFVDDKSPTTNNPHWDQPRYFGSDITFRLQYLDSGSPGVWRDYCSYYRLATPDYNGATPPGTGWPDQSAIDNYQSTNMPYYPTNSTGGLLSKGGVAWINDPRTVRFGSGEAIGNPFIKFPSGNTVTNGLSGATTNAKVGAMFQSFAASNNVIGTWHYGTNSFQTTSAYKTRISTNSSLIGITIPNNDAYRWDTALFINNSNAPAATTFGYYSDPDGVVRRASGAYVPVNAAGVISTNTGMAAFSSTTNWNTASPVTLSQSQSRPTMLHRPFRSVAELGYVFRDIPWKNIDFFTPESGDTGLLDVFCIHDNSLTNALTAGKVNLNTRQTPVLLALLSGSQADQLLMSGTTSYAITNQQVLISPVEMTNIANALARRTSTSPLSLLGDLVGQWGGTAYSGFSADLTNCYTNPVNIYIQRFHESAIRSLSNSGQTRVWNLLIDVVAQPGFFPAKATGMSSFQVQGEKRWWVHVAIDRFTAKVIDCQIEPVNE